MADVFVRQARATFAGTVGATAISAGDLVYFDGTDWELADADNATKFAEAVAVASYASGAAGFFCRSCILVDTDAPYTQGDQYYLSETAGALTATRPTTDGSLRQCVGFGLSTSEVYVDIAPVRELNVHMDTRGATSAFTMLDTGNFGGAMLDADAEIANAITMIPDNCVALEIAYLWAGVEGTTNTPVAAFTTGSTLGASGVQHDAVTADATLTAQTLEGAAADEIVKLAFTTQMDATNIIRPGALVGVKAIYTDGGTDVAWIFGIDLVCLVV
mgnify:CR=1 FL=1